MTAGPDPPTPPSREDRGTPVFYVRDGDQQLHGPFEGQLGLIDALTRLREDGHRHVEIMQQQMSCDFCSAFGPSWRYRAKDIVIFEGEGSSGDWAACDACYRLIEAESWDVLLLRISIAFKELHPEVPLHFAEAGFLAVLSAFREARAPIPASRILSDAELLG